MELCNLLLFLALPHPSLKVFGRIVTPAAPKGLLELFSLPSLEEECFSFPLRLGQDIQSNAPKGYL